MMDGYLYDSLLNLHRHLTSISTRSLMSIEGKSVTFIARTFSNRPTDVKNSKIYVSFATHYHERFSVYRKMETMFLETLLGGGCISQHFILPDVLSRNTTTYRYGTQHGDTIFF